MSNSEKILHFWTFFKKLQKCFINVEINANAQWYRWGEGQRRPLVHSILCSLVSLTITGPKAGANVLSPHTIPGVHSQKVHHRCPIAENKINKVFREKIVFSCFVYSSDCLQDFASCWLCWLVSGVQRSGKHSALNVITWNWKIGFTFQTKPVSGNSRSFFSTIDAETTLSISLTMSVSISFNLMTAYGVMRKKKIWLFPFLILYMGFIIECLAASIWITASRSPQSQSD